MNRISGLIESGTPIIGSILESLYPALKRWFGYDSKL